MANGHLSDAFADILLNAWLTKDATALPASMWVGLTLALPTDSNGTGIEIPTAVEYERMELPMVAGSWESMGAGSRSMATAIETAFFPADTDWGQILGYILYDSDIDGTYLGYGILNPYTIRAGMTAKLPAGAIVITLPAS
ncbi:MAG: phage tail fiber protein [Rhodoglobus sp.]